MQEVYFRLSAASAEDVRLRAQLDALRSKERRILARLEAVAQQMARLRREIESDDDATAAAAPQGKQPIGRDFGKSAWDITELRY